MFRRLAVSEWINDLAVVSLFLFLVIFVTMIVWVLRLPRDRIRKLEEMPLEQEESHHEPKH